jgi:hypothetical protein
MFSFDRTRGIADGDGVPDRNVHGSLGNLVLIEFYRHRERDFS